MITALNIEYTYSNPCKDLLASIIERAILDLRQPCPATRHAAYKWLFSDSTEEFSLYWCLHWLEIDNAAEHIRHKAKKIIRQAEKDITSVRYMHGSVLDLRGVRKCALSV